VSQCVAVCRSALHRVTFFSGKRDEIALLAAQIAALSSACHGQVLQCVAVCCSVLQCVAALWAAGVLWHDPACCSVLQRVAVCCSVWQRIAVCCKVFTSLCSAWAVSQSSVLQCVAVRRSVLQMLQCVAVCCSVLQLSGQRVCCVTV